MMIPIFQSFRIFFLVPYVAIKVNLIIKVGSFNFSSVSSVYTGMSH